VQLSPFPVLTFSLSLSYAAPEVISSSPVPDDSADPVTTAEGGLDSAEGTNGNEGIVGFDDIEEEYLLNVDVNAANAGTEGEAKGGNDGTIGDVGVVGFDDIEGGEDIGASNGASGTGGGGSGGNDGSDDVDYSEDVDANGNDGTGNDATDATGMEVVGDKVDSGSEANDGEGKEGEGEGEGKEGEKDEGKEWGEAPVHKTNARPVIANMTTLKVDNLSYSIK
jgi:hypothetical protein